MVSSQSGRVSSFLEFSPTCSCSLRFCQPLGVTTRGVTPGCSYNPKKNLFPSGIIIPWDFKSKLSPFVIPARKSSPGFPHKRTLSQTGFFPHGGLSDSHNFSRLILSKIPKEFAPSRRREGEISPTWIIHEYVQVSKHSPGGNVETPLSGTEQVG